jgi:hypothetical protein
MKPVIILILAVCTSGAFAQVDEIKDASSKNSAGSGGRGESGGGGGSWGIGFLFDGFQAFGAWQSMKLQNDRERYPSMVSLDVMAQVGVKPSSYYMFWPRVRGNWGLFSTDFRMNYLIEEDLDGFKHIRTSDWQILQVNLVTSRYFTFRLGTGIMKEAFGGKETFSETAILFNIHAPDQTKNLGFEYRFAKDWETGVNPRREFSVQYQHQILSAGALHGYVSVGGVYQNYYGAIEIWGVQAGLVFRIF